MTKLTESRTLEVFDENNIKVGDILKYKPGNMTGKLTVMVTEVSPFELTVLSLTHEIRVSKSHYFVIKPSEVERSQVEIAWKSN